MVMTQRLLEHQIANLRANNEELRRDLDGGLLLREPSDIRPGPRNPGPPRDEDQAQEDFTETGDEEDPLNDR